MDDVACDAGALAETVVFLGHFRICLMVGRVPSTFIGLWIINRFGRCSGWISSSVILISGLHWLQSNFSFRGSTPPHRPHQVGRTAITDIAATALRLDEHIVPGRLSQRVDRIVRHENE
ncbi:hypothetical protein [Mesorhizobium sp. M0276]|uniref:hypothetical protein n=1 Tax=Mesorhizobium sp. M0276 TaxID=2956928 RepID=UPI003339FF8F